MDEPVAAPELILRPVTGHDRRRLRTRGKLLAAGRALISEKGVDKLQIAEVTKAAGVGLGSFYNHFESTDELAQVVVSETLAALTQAMVVGVSEADDPAEIVCDAVRRFVRLAYDDPGFAQLVVQVDRADALMDEAVYPDAGRALRAGMSSGRFDIKDVRRTLVGVLGGALALMREILAGRGGDGAETDFAEHTMRGLGVPADECRALVARPLGPLG